jgi:enamine deaminase RidA (YjgF/YER057c/UK114 family)
MSLDPAARLAELGLELPDVSTPAGAYRPTARTGIFVLTAGQLPVVGGELPMTGKLGIDLTTEQGAELARTAALNVLAAAAAAAGGLERIRIVKITVFVASSPDFVEQHLVANGASALLGEVLGDLGLHARSAVGVASLPLDAPVEVEAIVEVLGN